MDSCHVTVLCRRAAAVFVMAPVMAITGWAVSGYARLVLQVLLALMAFLHLVWRFMQSSRLILSMPTALSTCNQGAVALSLIHI